MSKKKIITFSAERGLVGATREPLRQVPVHGRHAHDRVCALCVCVYVMCCYCYWFLSVMCCWFGVTQSMVSVGSASAVCDGQSKQLAQPIATGANALRMMRNRTTVH